MVRRCDSGGSVEILSSPEETEGPAASTVYHPEAPVSPARVLGSLQRGNGDPTQRRLADGSVWRTASTPLGSATLRLMRRPDGIHAAAWGPGAEWAVEQVPALLGAGDDASGFVPVHDVVARTWRRLRPMPLVATGLIFEAIVPAVLEQKVTGFESRSSWRALLRRYGEPAPGPAPQGMRICPPPSVWRRIPSWEWHRANVMPQRVQAILAAARVAHRLDESIAMPREDRLRRLRAIPGIGRWTAAEVAQRAWGDPDEVSYGDYHIPALVGWALIGRPVDDDGMMELLADYPGHRQRAVRLIELSDVSKPRFGPRMSPADIRAV